MSDESRIVEILAEWTARRAEEGRLLLHKAARLRGEPIDPNDRASAPYLREALERSGIRIEDVNAEVTPSHSR